jgi:methylmalonyl-CoA carboxyltransferase 5S subunit
VAPKFFAERANGPKSVAKDPNAPSATGTVAPGGTEPLREPIKYEVKVDGKKHQVTVSPA